MVVHVVASGSKGNCTVVYSYDSKIILDLGVGYSRFAQFNNFTPPDAVLITHEHGDHLKRNTLTKLLGRGLDAYVTPKTVANMRLQKSRMLHFVKSSDEFILNGGVFEVETVRALHDAADPVNYIIRDDKEETLFYIIDTGRVSRRFYEEAPTQVIIEANYIDEYIESSMIPEQQRERIKHNHLSLAQAIEALKNMDLSRCKEVHLVHISARHNDYMTSVILTQDALGDSVKVFGYLNGMTYYGGGYNGDVL